MSKLGFLLLCGGQSKRMGSHKALLEVGGIRLLDILARAAQGFDMRILSANDPAIPTPPGFLRCADLYPGCGPMAGIHAALSATDCDAVVTAPCDAPYYTPALAGYLAQQYDPAYDAVVLTDDEGFLQPLTGVYSRSCLPVLEEHLRSGKLKMRWMLESMKLKRISLPRGLDSGVFQNLNTPEDVLALRKNQA